MGGERAAPCWAWQWAQKDECAERTGAHARPKPTSTVYRLKNIYKFNGGCGTMIEYLDDYQNVCTPHLQNKCPVWVHSRKFQWRGIFRGKFQPTQQKHFASKAEFIVGPCIGSWSAVFPIQTHFIIKNAFDKQYPAFTILFCLNACCTVFTLYLV
jgi:hypothetical protein